MKREMDSLCRIFFQKGPPTVHSNTIAVPNILPTAMLLHASTQQSNRIESQAIQDLRCVGLTISL